MKLRCKDLLKRETNIDKQKKKKEKWIRKNEKRKTDSLIFSYLQPLKN